MGKIRLWHASRDAYHCAFRFLRLLLNAENYQIDLERARILDLYLLYPSLLHRASMPQEIKALFRELGLPHPDSMFVRLPSAGSLFRDLRLYQNTALSQLVAKRLIGKDALRLGKIEIMVDGVPEALRTRIKLKNEKDGHLMRFLLGPFSLIPLTGTDSIYRKAGLSIRMVTK